MNRAYLLGLLTIPLITSAEEMAPTDERYLAEYAKAERYCVSKGYPNFERWAVGRKTEYFCVREVDGKEELMMFYVDEL